ncbi:MAG: diguanylate cyclase, partial [Nitrospirae bacterium]
GFRSLEIEFTAIWFRNPRALRFRYRLGGPGSPWTDLGGERRIVVRGLPPGAHRLEIESRVGGGPWVAAARVPVILRRPRLSETRWFPAAAAVGGALVVLGLALIWLRGRRRREAFLEEEVRRRTRERDQVMELVAAVNQRASLAEILDTLFERLGEMVPLDRLGYATLREDGVVEATWARTASGHARLVSGTSAALQETSLRRLAETGETRVIPDLEAYLRDHPESETTRLLVEEGMRSSLAVPLFAFGKPAGFLFLDSARVGAYGGPAEALLRTLAAQISVILEKSRLMANLEEANRELRRQADTDELTGLANRRSFERHARLEWRRHARGRRPLAVVMVDVDRFKAYNDRLGHAAGDACLAKVGEVLAAAARRAGDLAARWGGEEFVLLFTDASRERALELAEALRREVEAMALPHPGTRWGVVTVSAGVASVVPPAGGGLERLLHAADRALYRAKEAGRNRVAVAPEEELL